MSSLKHILKAITPYGLVELRRRRLFPSTVPLSTSSERERCHALRRAAIDSVRKVRPDNTALDATDRAQVAGFLETRGVSPRHMTEGSMPEDSLACMRDHVVRLLPSSRPLIALHVGNFVGVSLAYLAAVLKKINPASMVLAVDPNLPHRGIDNPQEHVAALLCACGLQGNVVLVAGYSGAKSISNDGVSFENYDPARAFSTEAGCEFTLRNLSALTGARFDLVLMDGNHEAEYLENELHDVRPLMRSGGLLVLDDVDVYWPEIKIVFERVHELGLSQIATDGRIGIARAE